MIEENNLRDAGTSKNEVFAAYHELLRKLKETQKVPAAQVAQEEKIVEEKKQVVEVVVKETITNDLARHLINLRNSLNASLSDIETKLLEEREKFARLKEASDILTGELHNLYEIKPAADTLAALLLAHKEKSVTLEQEISQRKRDWKNEQEEFETALQNHQAQVRNEQQREEEDYIYKRDLMRQKEQDQYDSDKRKMEDDLTMKRLRAEEEFRIRDAQLVAREQEFEMLKEKIEQFPEELHRAMMETERNVTEKLELKHEYETKLREKDFENERKAQQQALAAMQAEVEHLKSRNYSFKTQSFNPQSAGDLDKLY
jgi:hypothetical protein